MRTSCVLWLSIAATAAGMAANPPPTTSSVQTLLLLRTGSVMMQHGQQGVGYDAQLQDSGYAHQQQGVYDQYVQQQGGYDQYDQQQGGYEQQQQGGYGQQQQGGYGQQQGLHLVPRHMIEKTGKPMRTDHLVPLGGEQVLGRYDIVDQPGQKLTISREQCVVRVAPDGSATLHSTGRPPTGHRTGPNVPWVWLKAGQSIKLAHGHKISLDKERPLDSVFVCQELGREGRPEDQFQPYRSASGGYQQMGSDREQYAALQDMVRQGGGTDNYGMGGEYDDPYGGQQQQGGGAYSDGAGQQGGYPQQGGYAGQQDGYEQGGYGQQQRGYPPQGY